MNTEEQNERLVNLIGGFSNRAFLYVIGCNGRVKIGKSVDPEARLCSLQTSTADPLELLVVVPEYVVSETDAHQRWKSLRVAGEWFTRSPELDAWIAALPVLEEVANRIRARVEHNLHRRTRPRRRMQKLSGIEAQLRAENIEQRKEQLRKHQAMEEARERALGCRLCSALFDKNPEGRKTPYPGKFCRPCANWLIRTGSDRYGEFEERDKLVAHIEKLRQQLAAHDWRVLKLSEYLMNLVRDSESTRKQDELDKAVAFEEADAEEVGSN